MIAPDSSSKLRSHDENPSLLRREGGRRTRGGVAIGHMLQKNRLSRQASRWERGLGGAPSYTGGAGLDVKPRKEHQGGGNLTQPDQILK